MVDKKRKNGFTLVELLVVITLMLSILGIAIVSFINISDKKKQEAWEDVKAQIETAAAEYFTANEYLFEGFLDGPSGSISVSKLVDEDYLNKITDPRTGKDISSCSIVSVYKKNNRLIPSFNEDTVASENTDCDNNSLIEVAEVNSPVLELETECNFRGENGEADDANHKSEWCYQYKAKLGVINMDINDNLEISYCISNTPRCNPELQENIEINKDDKKIIIIDNKDEKELKKSGIINKNRYITIKVSNETASRIIVTNSYNIDRNAPEGKLEITSQEPTYNSYNTNFNFEINDNDSGLSLVKDSGNNGDEYYNAENDGPTNEWKHNIEKDITDTKTQDGIERTKEVLLVDNVGNIKKITASYTPYKGCTVVTEQRQEDEGLCDCSTSKKTKNISITKKDSYTGASCGIEEEEETLSCTPTGCSINCPTFDYSDTRNKTKNGFYTSDTVYVNLTFDETVRSWRSYTNYAGTNNYKHWNTYQGNASDIATISGEGKRRIKITVIGADNKEKDCYSNWLYIDRTAPSCPTISFESGTKGNSGWYTSEVELKISPTNDTDHWYWYTKSAGTGWTYWSDNTGIAEKTLSGDGVRTGRVAVYDEAGNSRTCNTKTYSIDKTRPSIYIYYGPKKEKCGRGNSIRTKYEASDSTSGLKIVKDYYGYDASIPGASSSYWRTRRITSGIHEYSHDHNWGPYCTTKGTPGKGTCYKLKYYLEDVAGNVRKGYSGSCAKY